MSKRTGRNDETLVIVGKYGRANRVAADTTMHMYASGGEWGAGISITASGKSGEEYAYLNVSSADLRRLWQYLDNIYGKSDNGFDAIDALNKTVENIARDLTDTKSRVAALEAAEAERQRQAKYVPLSSVEPFWAGGFITTIKVLRERTGCGLKEAKETVEGWWPLLKSKPKWSTGERARHRDTAYIRVDPGGSDHCFVGFATTDVQIDAHVDSTYADCGWRKVPVTSA